MILLLSMVLVEKVKEGAEKVATVRVEQVACIFNEATSAHTVLAMRLGGEGTQGSGAQLTNGTTITLPSKP